MIKTKIPVLVLLFMLVMSLVLPVSQVSAAPSLEVQATAGINGKAKYQSVVPIKITVKNNGTDFSGDMAINAQNTHEIGSALIFSLDLAAGEEKTFELYLDGLADYGSSNDSKLFAFYEGGIEKGKIVSYKGTEQLQANFLEPSSTFIYTLTEKSDRLAAYLRLSQVTSSSNVEIFNLNQLKDYTLPDDAQGYAMANVIAVDEFALVDLSQKQQEALLKWVQEGGKLLLGASDQVEATAGIFKEFLPLTLSQQTTTVSVESLTKLSGGGTFTSPISVYTATENSGSTRVLANEATILAAKKKVGGGEIIQTTFSLGDNPLASMDGYATLTAKMLNIQNSMQQGDMNGNSTMDRVSYELRSVNELFPSFEVSVTYMLVVIILYILIIGPLLYFVLKKMDKREHAWWIIPAISIMLSVALFIFGAKDRLMQPQVQQSAFYKVNEDKSVSGYYVESILTNRGGDFVVETDTNTTAVAFRNRNNIDGSMKNLHESSYIKEHPNGSTLTLRDLSYWSVQSFTGKTATQNIGNMDIDITLKDEKLSGTVKNNFPFVLKDVTLISGIKEVKLGDIEPNETLHVDQALKTTVLQKPMTYGNNSYMYPAKKEEIDPLRIESMKSMALSLTENDELPVLTAWADQAIAGVELDSSANMAPISYFVQPFEGKVELTGPFTMKRTNLTYTVGTQSANGYFEMYDEQLNTGYMQEGSYDVKIALPENFMTSVQSFDELTVSNKDTKRMELFIWNNEKSAFEALTDTNQVFTENINHYFDQEDEVLLQIKFGPDQTGEPTTLPELELKGVAK
ncbi:hypothetical protein AEA09_14465 [Lysinibacillus contaminans]|uniref:Uncharacterized protein n=1 Tax=Lysinibacillus contaminans TaxID=1293441 RepID=A0ABR5K434_9BACI|nr:hypothetical protein [Lysinibacillus contaminans]KOS69658.1 hypothetical protein AEA09_14465 [Lysinibacillus contaminans]